MNLEKLDTIFELTTEVLLTYRSDGSGEKDTDAIQRLNDELWNAGYQTWILQKDDKPCLSVRPRSDR